MLEDALSVCKNLGKHSLFVWLFVSLCRMLLIPGTETPLWNGERGTGNGERGTANGSLGTSVQ